MHKKQRLDNIRKNLHYLLFSRGESRVSLCESTGLNRTTIYNILDGRVSNIHKNTISKVSDFFGMDYQEIEHLDLQEKERIDALISIDGNMNPAAVPIIRQSQFDQLFEKRIGELAALLPLTYYFGHDANLLAILIEKKVNNLINKGDLLIIKRGLYISSYPKLYYTPVSKTLSISHKSNAEINENVIIGDVLEERLNYGK